MAAPPRAGEYGQELRTPAIPAVRKDNINDILGVIKEWIEVRQGTRGDGLDRAVTLRDLLNSGLAQPFDLRNLNPGGTAPFPIGTGNTDPDTPPAPTDLEASGTFKYVLLTWNFVRGYSRLAYFEVWRSVTNDLTAASVIAQTYGPIYADEIGPGAAYYYWVRAVSDSGVGPYNSSQGTLGATEMDPAYLIGLLTGQITETQLFADLGARINLIDATDAVTGSVNARVKAETDARVAAFLDEQEARTTYVQSYTYSKAESNEALSFLATTVAAGYTAYADARKAEAISAAAADVRTYAFSQANTTSAIAASSNAVRAEITAAGYASQAYVQSYTYSKAQSDSAETAQTNAITASYTTYADTKKSEAITTAAADVRTYGYSKAAVDGAFASQSTAINAAYIEAVTVASADVRFYSYSKAGTDGAIASATSSLSTTVDGHTTTLQSNAISIGGLQGQYTWKIDANGYVSGFGLASTIVGATPQSIAIFRSDSFAIGSPSGPGIAPQVPFIVRTTSTTLGGVTVPVGVYMTDTFIQNGSISNAKIANLAVDDAKIVNLTVAKLLAGKLGVGEYIESTNYLAGDTGFRIHGNGNAEFRNVTVRGVVLATSGEIGGNTIDSTGVQSPNYTSTTGWRINSNGTAVLNNAVIRGQLIAASGTLGIITAATIQSGASGQRVVQTEKGISIYDASNNRRAHFGDQS